MRPRMLTDNRSGMSSLAGRTRLAREDAAGVRGEGTAARRQRAHARGAPASEPPSGTSAGLRYAMIENTEQMQAGHLDSRKHASEEHSAAADRNTRSHGKALCSLRFVWPKTARMTIESAHCLLP